VRKKAFKEVRKRARQEKCIECAQSIKPLHADMDALRAVSTVPPMTNEFLERNSFVREKRIERRKGNF